ncbi:hypothetical protein D9615_004139 [Tricholomella constricta]|uniref:tRNA(Ile)-lysidine synthetase n=1 Tax=Tricholomella constricta TaxID=117010 RepID=A0A8H5HCX9_9AGAR|nr:hypothetical protein D9615_004139 [Tricholomella constricta]
MSVRSLPIGNEEFARMFQKCIPPVGWMKEIGVANSGGPDSTCLLFLIHRYLSDVKHVSSQDSPRNVVSLTVDHDLQPTSSAMAEHCSEFAQSLGVQHITSKVPWSQSPFPPRPVEGEPFESIARTARYRSLFQSMTRKNLRVLAFGHHADDQVETSLIRLSWGSTAAGAGGMRPCRRWGMGMDQGDSITSYGYEGMDRWIVRPLLDVVKERILATCEANNLQYVTDPTNFNPSATLRNAIRHELRHDSPEGMTEADRPLLPLGIVERLKLLEKTAGSLRDVSLSLDSSPDELRSAVSILTSNVKDTDERVDSILKRCSLPTLPGTFMMSALAIRRVDDPTIRRALVLRIMRYASYHPWGSMRADAGRRKGSISQVVDQLWKPFHTKSILRPFTAGGGVLWTPVVVRGNSIKFPKSTAFAGIREDETVGWLVSRQPPMNRLRQQERGLPNRLEINATNPITEGWHRWKSGGAPVASVLYDCRFLVQFNLEKMPREIASRLLDPDSQEKMMVYSKTRWYWPSVALEGNGNLEVFHDKISEKATNPFLGDADARAETRLYPHGQSESLDSGWISIEWIRPLTAL